MSIEANPLDFFTTEQLFEEIKARQESQEAAYMFYWGLADETAWMYMSNVDYDQIQEIYEMEMEDWEGYMGVCDPASWTPDSDLEDQFEEDWADDEDDIF